MIIGVPKEIKNNENRVALTPAGTSELVKNGHTLYVQTTAGNGSGFSDEEYVSAGAKILPTIEEVYGIAERIFRFNWFFNLDNHFGNAIYFFQPLKKYMALPK